ncbi:hypothetical protein L798_11163 [Zootermopsis nevadensis]|uniref:Uncharacterized protein n=1 Tax=Zootermopsis nevadensis TaxID=136037 RepID=A0A067RIS9_ZOONE|nr:hypothetical protein L798_11163 [Zootermopsis nevadensis]
MKKGDHLNSKCLVSEEIHDVVLLYSCRNKRRPDTHASDVGLRC